MKDIHNFEDTNDILEHFQPNNILHLDIILNLILSQQNFLGLCSYL